MGQSEHSHVVSRGYLRGFESERGTVTVHDVVTGKTYETGANEVGVRRNFYRRERPDGSNEFDVEESLAFVEDRGIPLLRAIGDLWPLCADDKGAIATLLALQHVRTPGWRDFIGELHVEAFASYRRERLDGLDGEQHEITERSIAAAETQTATATHVLHRMLSQVYKAASVMACMHWRIVDFAVPRLVTCDQPVVVWPIGLASSQPCRMPYNAGLLASLEIRFPLDPERALLMAWLDLADPIDPDRGLARHARSLNAFTRAQADRHWIHHPQMAPRFASGPLLPISPELVTGYTQALAATCVRRQQIAAILDSHMGRTADGTERVTVLEVAR